MALNESVSIWARFWGQNWSLHPPGCLQSSASSSTCLKLPPCCPPHPYCIMAINQPTSLYASAQLAPNQDDWPLAWPLSCLNWCKHDSIPTEVHQVCQGLQWWVCGTELARRWRQCIITYNVWQLWVWSIRTTTSGVCGEHATMLLYAWGGSAHISFAATSFGYLLRHINMVSVST